MTEAAADASKEVDTGTDAAANAGTDAADAKAGNTTLLNGAASDKPAEGDKDASSDAPDWRARLAGDDKDALKRLSRFSDEAAFYKSYRALESKLSSGDYKKALPEGASDEERATWRKENGLPEKAEGYVEALELPKGLVIGEADKPIVGKLAETALAENLPPKAFNGLVAKYYELQDAQRAAQEDADASYKQESEDALRADWQGAAFRQNLTAVNNLIASWPADLAANILAARTPDGRKVGDNPIFIKQLAALAVELNPTSTLVPAGTTDPGKTVESELAEIRKLRREDPNAYDADKKLQARELELLTAQEKMKSRNAA